MHNVGNKDRNDNWHISSGVYDSIFGKSHIKNGLSNIHMTLFCSQIHKFVNLLQNVLVLSVIQTGSFSTITSPSMVFEQRSWYFISLDDSHSFIKGWKGIGKIILEPVYAMSFKKLSRQSWQTTRHIHIADTHKYKTWCITIREEWIIEIKCSKRRTAYD